MELYSFITLEKMRTIFNNDKMEIEEAKTYLDDYTCFSAFRPDTYPGKDKLYISKERAIEEHSWPGLLISITINDNDELEDLINKDIDNEYHYFSKYKIEIIVAPEGT